MKVKLNLNKTLQQSANEYFEQSKKLRRKIETARKVVSKFEKQLAELEKKQELIEEQEAVKEEKAPKEWYEKFRWFISSEGFLCIGGRDATSNEIVVKKHMDDKDIVFHTEAPGSPFFVIQTKGKTPGEATIEETAIATACFSKAWKLGVTVTEVFWVNPDQVSKQAPSGEYMPKGAFMVRGKRNILRPTLELSVGKLDGKIMCGPRKAVYANCKEYADITQGNDKPSDVAKKIAKKLNASTDDVLKVLPAGGSQLA